MPIEQVVDETRLDAYVRGAVDDVERTVIEAHLAACRECRRAVLTQLIVAGVGNRSYSDS